MAVSRTALEAIQRRDPDGWETREPTDADREAFREWVIGTYGPDAWERYHEPWDQ